MRRLPSERFKPVFATDCMQPLPHLGILALVVPTPVPVDIKDEIDGKPVLMI
ncbi:hypothetical protein D3C80_1204630 [compost metagenome]